MFDLSSIPSYIIALLGLCLTIGGLLAIKQGYSRQVSEIQERVIKAYKEEIETMGKQIEACQKRITHKSQIIATIRYTMKQRGYSIVISDDYITMTEHGGNKTRTIQITEKEIKNDDEDTAKREAV